MKKNRGVLSEKERLNLLVKSIAENCVSLDELAIKLESHNLTPYYLRNILKGIWMGKRKLRLTTLGIDKSHIKKLTKEQERLNSLKTKQQKFSRNRER